MEPLDLEDIQGNILRGYRSTRAAYLFFEAPDAASGRSFLADLVDDVQNAADWGERRPATFTNIAVTAAGLLALGVDPAIYDTLPPAFVEPIRERAPRLLDDVGPSAPEQWADGIGTDRSHILVIVNASEGCDQEFLERSAAVRSFAASHRMQLVHDQEGGDLETRREHFGWADGLSQPTVEGTPWASDPGGGVPEKDGSSWHDLKAGEFILGYLDEDGQKATGPVAPLLQSGTFMVYRKLYQDVVRFRAQLRADSLRYGATLPDDPPLDADQLYELMAAKVVGRWRDGLPIEGNERRQEAHSRALGDEALKNPNNDFRYLPDDTEGFVCPKGSHIRRTNPRDALGWRGDGRMSERHRIIRRGMPYGPFRSFAEGQEDDGADRGLIFICFNANIERQFEVMQRHWCNDGNAFHLGNEKDYLLGDIAVGAPPTTSDEAAAQADGRLRSERFMIQGDPPHFVGASPPVVLTRGCEYLLMPGLEALRALARGTLGADDGSWPVGERSEREEIVAISRSKLEADYPAGTRPVRRDQHAKAHGCVRAEFEVRTDLPQALRHGVLAEPLTYSAWIRFSSSAAGPKLPPDSKRDAHGMAIKLLDVPGDKILAAERQATTQDFVLANSKVFFCRNASEYVELARLMSNGKLLRFFLGWSPLKWRLRELFNLLVATRQKVRNPLQIQYWSQTPFALGPYAVKYSAAPMRNSSSGSAPPSASGENFLEEAMAHQLAAGDCTFDFMVQLQGDPEQMPIDDPTVRWSERASPFQTVATIRIPAQEFTSEAQKAFAEHLSFTPWHSLPEHQPLGAINRVRRDVYEAISSRRNELNDVPKHEPTGADTP